MEFFKRPINRVVELGSRLETWERRPT